MKSENHEICHDIICGGYGKKLRRFHKSWHMRCLQIEASPKKFQRVGVKVTGEFGFDFKTFCIGKHNLDSFIPNFGYFSDPFDNFKFFMQLNISRWTVRP